MATVYISGPITGHDDYRERFRKAEAELRGRGHRTVNPAANELGDDATWQDYMRHDIAQLLTCDAIYLLHGWRESRGAFLEHRIAESLGMAEIVGSAWE